MINICKIMTLLYNHKVVLKRIKQRIRSRFYYDSNDYPLVVVLGYLQRKGKGAVFDLKNIQ